MTDVLQGSKWGRWEEGGTSLYWQEDPVSLPEDVNVAEDKS